MERERPFEHDPFRHADVGPQDVDSLDAVRSDMDRLLHAADHALDSISFLQAEQYLEQNLQTGGQ